MSIQIIEAHATERSTYFVTVSFKDENDIAVTPNANTVTWSLIERSGYPEETFIINNREDIPEESDNEVVIVLSGDDLALEPNGSNVRFVIVKCEYNSTLGSDLPLVQIMQFEIDPIT